MFVGADGSKKKTLAIQKTASSDTGTLIKFQHSSYKEELCTDGYVVRLPRQETTRNLHQESALHSFEVNQISTRLFLGISSGTKTGPMYWLFSSEAVELYPYKGTIIFFITIFKASIIACLVGISVSPKSIQEQKWTDSVHIHDNEDAVA